MTNEQLPSSGVAYERDPALSFRARGVLAHLLAGDPGESIDATALAAGAREGREAVETALGELQAAGYVQRERCQMPTGRWYWRSAFGATPDQAADRMARLVAADAIPRAAARTSAPVRVDATRDPASGPEWSGLWPLERDAVEPTRGRTPVVYVLDPHEPRPLYVGSTDRLRARLRQHAATRTFTRWEAYVCPSRHDAYRFEAMTVDRLRPRANGHDIRLASITSGGAR